MPPGCCASLPERVGHSIGELRDRVRELERAARRGGRTNGAVDVDQLAAGATQTAGANVLVGGRCRRRR